VTLQIGSPVAFQGFLAAHVPSSIVAPSDDDRPIRGTRVQWSHSRAFKHLVGSKLVAPKVRTVTVRHLKAHTRYHSRARTIDKAGHRSAWTHTIRVTTKRR
jgi:hypothetical protein